MQVIRYRNTAEPPASAPSRQAPHVQQKYTEFGRQGKRLTSPVAPSRSRCFTASLSSSSCGDASPDMEYPKNKPEIQLPFQDFLMQLMSGNNLAVRWDRLQIGAF